MKEKFKIKKYTSILSIFGLILLFLLSPCKVRNFVQTELGAPQTNVLNKSKTTITTSCVAFNTTEINHSSLASVTKAPIIFFNKKLFAFPKKIQSKVKKAIRISVSKRISSTPLYILHQSIQVYS